MMPLPDAVRAALPQAPEACVETHISWVLLAGAFAYKVKKPVTLPFLDYGTVARRRRCCDEELRLNRRFAPDLYLDVVDLGGEPAVRMRRFDAAARLDHVCRRGALGQPPLRRFARDLAAFQATAAVTRELTFGTPDAIRADALENFAELERLLDDARLAPLKAWTEAEFVRRRADFARRHAAGRVREGHGDLHLGNLVLLDGCIVPFDGIEFNAAFRWIDVANEIAFTLLDLLDHGQPGLASGLLSEWLDWSGDHDALTVLRFYLVYRALVRAKVAALRGDRAEAGDYLDRAGALTVPPQPRLTITCGLSGSGKTTESGRRLWEATALDTVRLRSDVERKRLFGLAPDADSGGTIYGPDAHARTYAQLEAQAAAALRAGWSVIVDAAFLKRAERDRFRALAGHLGVSCALLATAAPPDTLARRLVQRRQDASEATVAVLEQQRQVFEPPGPDEQV